MIHDIKRLDFYTNNSVKCKCGHTVFISNKSGRTICSFCGYYVYKDEKTKFRFKLMEEKKKNEKNNKNV